MGTMRCIDGAARFGLVCDGFAGAGPPVGPGRPSRPVARGGGAEPSPSPQYRTIGMLSIVAAAAIFGFYFFNREVKNIEEMGEGTFWKVTISFLIGAACSAIAGFIGVFVSIRANIRPATAALTSLTKA